MISSSALMMITTKLSTQDTIENTLEDIETTMTGKVTDIKTGGDMDILAIITGVITTTHMSNNIADTGSPSTSTDSLMIGGSTGGRHHQEQYRHNTDYSQNRYREQEQMDREQYYSRNYQNYQRYD